MTLAEQATRCDFCEADLLPVTGLETHGCAQCPSCGTVLCTPRPALAEVVRQYEADDYYTTQWSPAELAALSAGLRPLARAVRREVGAGARVLDVGCAAGVLLAALRDAGLRASGIDVSGTAVSQAREVFGVKAHRALIEDYELPSGLDAIVALHVFEHLVRPAEFLRRARSALRPGGLLVIEVPDYGAFTRRRLGPRWPHLRPGEHLQHFDESALRAVCRRNGFRPFRLQRVGGLGVLDHVAAHEESTSEHQFGLPAGLRGRLYRARHLVYRIPGSRALVRALNDLIGYRLLHRNANIRIWVRRQ